MKTTQHLQRRISALGASRSNGIVVYVKAVTGGPIALIACQGREWARTVEEPADKFRDRFVHELRGITDLPLLVLVDRSVGAAAWPLMEA